VARLRFMRSLIQVFMPSSWWKSVKGKWPEQKSPGWAWSLSDVAGRNHWSDSVENLQGHSFQTRHSSISVVKIESIHSTPERYTH